MKRIIYTILASLVLLASCSKEQVAEQPKPEGDTGENIRLCASIEKKNSDTKVNFDYDNNFSWEMNRSGLPFSSCDNLILAGFDDANKFLGWSHFKLKELVGERAYFDGPTVTGATHYKITYFYQDNSSDPWTTADCSGYDKAHFEETGEMIMNYDYNSYRFKHSLEYPGNSKMNICMGTEVNAEDLKNPIQLKLYNTAIWFEFLSLPETMGHVKEFTWINNEGTPDECALEFNFNDDFELNGKKLFTFIDPQKMNLKAGNRIVIRFSGEGTHIVQATSIQGKNYEGGKKYFIKISDKEVPSQQTLHDWKLAQQNNEIWFESKTAGAPIDANQSWYEMHHIPNTKTYILRCTGKDENGHYLPFTELGVYGLKDNIEANKDFYKAIFPITVKSIANSSPFYGVGHIKEYVFHKDCPLTEIPSYAFDQSGLQKITLPDALTTICEGAFRNSELAEIIFPSNLRTIGEVAFSRSKLQYLNFPEGLETIGFEAFYNSDQMVQITIPSTVREIGEKAFYQINGALTDVFCKATSQTLQTVGATCFANGEIETRTTLHLPEVEKNKDHPLKVYRWKEIRYDL